MSKKAYNGDKRGQTSPQQEGKKEVWYMEFFFVSVYDLVTWIGIALCVGLVLICGFQHNWRGFMWSAALLICLAIIMIAIRADQHFFQRSNPKESSNEKPELPHPDRAYVVISQGSLDSPPKTGNYPVATLHFENTGRTAAVNVRVRVSTSLIKDKAKELAKQGIMPKIEQKPFESSAVLGAGKISKYITPKVGWPTPEARELTMQGRFVLFIWGEIYFDDIFGGKWTSRFCMSADDPNIRQLRYCLHGNTMEERKSEPEQGSLGSTSQVSPTQNERPSSLPRERPEVFIERVTVEILEAGKPETVSLELKNRGKSTAHNVQVHTTHAHQPISFEGPLPSRVNNVPDSHSEIVPDGKGISVTRSTWLMTDRWMREIKERSRLFFVYGTFSYEDEDGIPYRGKFCYMFDPDFPRMMAICPDRYWPREAEEQKRNP